MKSKTLKKMKKGFTMIELLIVIAIALVLATIFSEFGLHRMHRSLGYAMAAEMQKLESAAQGFYNEKNTWPVNAAELIAANYLPPSWKTENFWKIPYVFQTSDITLPPGNPGIPGLTIHKLVISTSCPNYISQYVPAVLPGVEITSLDTKNDTVTAIILPIDHIIAMKNKITHDSASDIESRTLRGDIFLKDSGRISSLKDSFQLDPSGTTKMDHLEVDTLIVNDLTFGNDFKTSGNFRVNSSVTVGQGINNAIDGSVYPSFPNDDSVQYGSGARNTTLQAANIFPTGSDTACVANNISPSNFSAGALSGGSIRAGTWSLSLGSYAPTQADIDTIYARYAALGGGTTPPPPPPPPPPGGGGSNVAFANGTIAISPSRTYQLAPPGNWVAGSTIIAAAQSNPSAYRSVSCVNSR
jgi:prepilin-type N-terminal cleavage/methylation domain-containing protein